MEVFKQQRGPDRGIVAEGTLRIEDRGALLEALGGLRDMPEVPFDMTGVTSIDQGGIELITEVAETLYDRNKLCLRVRMASSAAEAVQAAGLELHKRFDVDQVSAPTPKQLD